MTKHSICAFLLLLCAFIPMDAQATSSITSPGTLGGATSLANSVSNNGLVIVGQSHNGVYSEAYKWDSTNGMVGLGNLFAGSPYSVATSTNSDGTVIVGASFVDATHTNAFIWTSGTGMVGLGHLGINYSWARAVSADGLVVVGESIDTNFKAFRWTSGTGMVSLGTLGGSRSYAFAVNDDGSVIAGRSRDVTEADHAYRWTSGTGMVNLGDLGGGTSSAFGINPDGTVIVGESYNGSYTEAFRWTSGTGMVGLGRLNFMSSATATNTDGSVVVGYSYNGAAVQKGFLWNNTDGMQSLEDILTTRGVDITGWSIGTAFDISDDGTIIVGTGTLLGAGKAYIITLGPNIGITTPDDLVNSLVPLTVPSRQTFSLFSDGMDQSLLVARNTLTSYFPKLPIKIIDSAMSTTTSPQNIMPAAGIDEELSGSFVQKRIAFYTTGTFGLAQNNNFSNSSVNGTAGVLVELNQFSALGAGIIQSKDKQETRLDGESVAQATGISFLGAYEHPSGFRLYGTTAFAHINVDSSRNYLNGSGIDTSTGETQGYSVGASTRLGYKIDVADNHSIMPYVETQFSHNKINDYTENDGAFPVRVNGQSNNSLRTLVGMEVSSDITSNISMRAHAAWGHKYTKDDSVSISSTLITQTISPEETDRNWGETGLSFNYKFRPNTTISGQFTGRSGETSAPAISSTIGIVWNWN